MSDLDGRWRCPYCDGLNDWQNEVCEICGDVTRAEVEAAEKAALTVEMPKVYTPREREREPAPPKREPEREAPGPAYAPPPAPEPPKEKKNGCVWLGIWVVLIFVILACLFGSFLDNRSVTGIEEDRTDATASPISMPMAPVEPKSEPVPVIVYNTLPPDEPEPQPEIEPEPEIVYNTLPPDEPQPQPEIVYETLQRGMRGDAVVSLQKRLIELGYLNGAADGIFDKMTEKAVRTAQEAFGMEANGIADNAFQHRLYEGV